MDERSASTILSDWRSFIASGFLEFHTMETKFLSAYQAQEWERLIRDTDRILTGRKG